MVLINKAEMMYLTKHGFKFQEDLHKTYSNRGTYYATESDSLMKCLNNYRKSKITNEGK